MISVGEASNKNLALLRNGEFFVFLNSLARRRTDSFKNKKPQPLGQGFYLVGMIGQFSNFLGEDVEALSGFKS